MTEDQFDRDDIEALRNIRPARSAEKPALDGRRLRSPPGDAVRDVQMNARVRREIKEMAHEIARAQRCTIADVIELAIEKLHAAGATQPIKEPVP